MGKKIESISKSRKKISRRNIFIFTLFGIITSASFILTFYNFQFVEQGSHDSIIIYGNVKREVNITLFQLKSQYQQVVNQMFYFINKKGVSWEETYTGAVIWDIFVKEDCLNPNSTSFQFIAADAYAGPPINISVIQNSNSVILAYEKEGNPMAGLPDEGPIKAIVNRSLFPDWNTKYNVRNVVAINIY